MFFLINFLCIVGEEITPEMNSLQFDLATIQVATNKFSEDNKIGEGGFGEVYKVINLCQDLNHSPEILLNVHFDLY